MKQEWQSLCQRLGYQFQNPELLRQALTHKSYLPEEFEENYGNNERLEFLGDAVLDLVVSELLMEHFPELEEGGLSKFRASLVSESGFSKQAEALDLGKSLLLGRGEEMTGGRKKSSLLADAFEAVIAAIYLDSRDAHGIAQVAWVIQNLFCPSLPKNAEEFITRDYKSEFQEYVQKICGVPSTYQIVEESGPDHEKEFTMAVFACQRECGRGKGSSKKQASRLAAKDALQRVQNDPSFFRNKQTT